MVLSIERVRELLAASEGGMSIPQELQDRRYIVLHGLDPEAMRDPPDEDDPFYDKAKDWVGLRVAGESTRFDEALRLLWESIQTLQKQFTVVSSSDESWQEGLSTWLEEGPWEVPDDEIAASVEFGIELAKRKYPISRFEFAFFGGAPYEGESAAIIEVPRKVELSARNKNLLAACRKNDIPRVRELLAKKADVNTSDSHGDTPLHHAVACRNHEMVAMLLDAGADPTVGARFYHSPIFAKRASRGETLPWTEQFDDENHFAIACLLVERGANPLATRPTGQTLVDLAANHVPMNERWVRHFMNLGTTSCFMRTSGMHRRPLDELLGSIHFHSAAERARIPNRVRVLGWLGCDPNETANGLGKETPVESWLTTGYYNNEVEPEVIIGIAQALVDIGARDEVGLSDSRKPSDRAEMWGRNAKMRHYAEAARILREPRTMHHNTTQSKS